MLSVFPRPTRRLGVASLIVFAISAPLSAAIPPPPDLQPPPLIEIDESKVTKAFFVAPEGNDAADGSVTRPFATLSRARDAIRELKKKGPLPAGGVAVNVRAGGYALTRSFELSAEDSGAAAAPVVYRAWPGETPRLHGARLLGATDFKPVTDPKEAERLDASARGQVVKLDLAALKITNAGPFPKVFSDHGGLFELFVNGDRMPLSRWPNTALSRCRTGGCICCRCPD